MSSDYTSAELKLWITQLHDPQTPVDELQRIAKTLAHIDHPEALRALEQFRKTPRVKDVGWIDCAIEECTYGMLSPRNENETKDYIRVELWQAYEREWLDKIGQRDAAEVHKQQLEVEKEFLDQAMAEAPNEGIRLQLMGHYSGIDHLILMAENDRINLEEKIAGLEFILEQIEKAIESPIYRNYGKGEIGVHIHRDCDLWLIRRKGKDDGDY